MFRAPFLSMPTSTAEREITVTRHGVELVSVGTWDASTGKTKVTAADLQAMVAASHDPHYDAAPMKIGHDDDRFQDVSGKPPSTRDGEPAYGWIENLRVTEDGKTLLGDMVGVPKLLADVMDTALRRRSVELTRHDTVGGKVYAAVLKGLSLLGVQAPAVKGLADLRALFADQLQLKPERFSLLISDDTPSIPQSKPGNLDGEPEANATPQLGASVMAVQMKLSPAQREALGIGDDATDEEISAILLGLGLQLGAAEPVKPAATVTPAVAQAPVVATTDPTTPAAPVRAAPKAADPVPVAAPVVAPTVVADVTPQAVAASAARLGFKLVDDATFQQFAADAADGREARAEQVRIRRDNLVRAAQAAGKIVPASFEHFRKMADDNEAGLVELFSVLPVILPVEAIGHSELYSGGLPAPTAADNATTAASRAAVYDYFTIDAPDAATPKG